MNKISVPLRVDFAGGWLDVPDMSRYGGHIVNCAIAPLVTKEDLAEGKLSGLGGSAASAILEGRDGIKAELQAGAGWQDPAIISETGLCVWRSSRTPTLELKQNPFPLLYGRMALLWTEPRPTCTVDIAAKPKDLAAICKAGRIAHYAVRDNSLQQLAQAVRASYAIQLAEGMAPLPEADALAWKYCGSGFGGNALYLFECPSSRRRFLREVANTRAIEPYMERYE